MKTLLIISFVVIIILLGFIAMLLSALKAKEQKEENEKRIAMYANETGQLLFLNCDNMVIETYSADNELKGLVVTEAALKTHNYNFKYFIYE